MIRIRKTYVEESFESIELKALVDRIIDDEGPYFLNYSDEDMFEEFYDLTCDLVEDEEDLTRNKEEIMKLLQEKRDENDEEYYDDCVEEAISFIEDGFTEEFWDTATNIVYDPEKKSSVYRDAIKKIYKDLFGNEEVE